MSISDWFGSDPSSDISKKIYRSLDFLKFEKNSYKWSGNKKWVRGGRKDNKQSNSSCY